MTEFGYGDYRWLSLRDRRYKYNFYMNEGREELYDMVNDPQELANLLKDGPGRETQDIAERMHERLVNWELEYGFTESVEMNRLRSFDMERPHRVKGKLGNCQFPKWVENASPEELKTVETKGETIVNAIARESVFRLTDLDLKTWKEMGGDLSGTEYEEAWRNA